MSKKTLKSLWRKCLLIDAPHRYKNSLAIPQIPHPQEKIEAAEEIRGISQQGYRQLNPSGPSILPPDSLTQ